MNSGLWCATVPSRWIDAGTRHRAGLELPGGGVRTGVPTTASLPVAHGGDCFGRRGLGLSRGSPSHTADLQILDCETHDQVTATTVKAAFS